MGDGRAGWLSRGCGGAVAVCTSSGPLDGAGRSLVIAADSGRDLAWPYQRVAAELLARHSPGCPSIGLVGARPAC